MEKPIVFLSHSSSDSKVLTRLKTALEKKTHNTIDFFLSSDGESIPFGKNWVATIQQALERANLTFVFISPQSVNSGWVHFESGFVYGKGIKVIPVAMPGIDLGKVPAPLNLLQGFNIHSHESLNNILAVLNKEFDAKHQDLFSKGEYLGILGGDAQADIAAYFGDSSRKIQLLQIEFAAGPGFIGAVKRILDSKHIEHNGTGDNKIASYGFRVSRSARPESVLAEIDPGNPVFAFDILDKASKASGTKLRFNILIHFSSSVSLSRGLRATAGLRGTEIKLAPERGFCFRDLQFDFVTPDDEVPFDTSLALTCKYLGKLREAKLPELIEALFDSGLLR